MRQYAHPQLQDDVSRPHPRSWSGVLNSVLREYTGNLADSTKAAIAAHASLDCRIHPSGLKPGKIHWAP